LKEVEPLDIPTKASPLIDLIMSLYETKAIGKRSADGKFEKMVVSRAGTSDMDVDFDIKFCGLCHTDLLVVKLLFLLLIN